MYALSAITGSFPLPILETIKLGKNALSNIRYFRKTWSHYCLVTGLDKMSEEIKYDVLRTMIGEEASWVIDNFFLLNPEGKKNADEVLQALENQFLPSCENLVLERMYFNQIFQKADETIQSFVSRITVQAFKCGFENVDEIMRDRFIAGLRDNALRRSLIRNYYLSLEGMIAHSLKEEAISNKVQPMTLAAKLHNGSFQNLSSEMKIERQENRDVSAVSNVMPASTNIKEEIIKHEMNEQSWVSIKKMPPAIPLPLPMKLER